MNRCTRNLLVAIACATAFGAHAQVSQSGPNPVALTSGAPSDVTQVLMGMAAARASDMSVNTPDPRKNFWIQNFLTSADYLSWTVNSPAAATYHVFALLNANAGQGFTITDDKNAAKAGFSASGYWDRISVGTLTLPAGTSTIKLQRSGTLTGDAQVKSLELISDADYTAYLGRVAKARGNTSWLAGAKYGLFFQYGSWGFPNNVGLAKSLNQQAADFDVPSFVQMVKDTGAQYVIWSFSWWNFKPDMTNTPLSNLMGSGYTSQRNLIAEIAAALKQNGIRFALYYHAGYEDSGWWSKQNFPSTYPSTGTGDRSTFFDNWKSVVTDIGNTLGTNLDAFFFDDGAVFYYPAPFEALENAARSGNAARLISWNSWVMPRVTDFQDVYFGEQSDGSATIGSAPVGGNGIFVSGPQAGLLQHGMMTMESDNQWGIHQQNQKIGATAISSAQAASLVKSASARNVPLSFNLEMYEDGSTSDSTLAALYGLRNTVYGTAMQAPTWTMYNDNWSSIAYSGSWRVASNRGAGDYNNDVHYTTVNGDSLTVTFTGTGIILTGPMSPSDGQASVTLDGAHPSTINAVFGGKYTPQQHLIEYSHLSSGTHTLKITKTGGTYLQIDAVSIAN
ncbi:alpha-L-fucosidase [Burkholderia alba]|uniref:alpha-L-fucosidase n=1 Tax=Burkholderia alba TaxID=2683677 RepID=UPI002B05273D|nr:alpha-L-fucosidase [Burkholderia alba]